MPLTAALLNTPLVDSTGKVASLAWITALNDLLGRVRRRRRAGPCRPACACSS